VTTVVRLRGDCGEDNKALLSSGSKFSGWIRHNFPAYKLTRNGIGNYGLKVCSLTETFGHDVARAFLGTLGVLEELLPDAAHVGAQHANAIGAQRLRRDDLRACNRERCVR